MQKYRLEINNLGILVALYLVTYDLNRPGQDYPGLYDKISECGSAWHGMQNVWFVDTPWNAQRIRDHVIPTLDRGDKLFVSRVQEAAWQGFTDEATAWIKAKAT